MKQTISEPAASESADRLPDYAELLRAFHVAYAGPLRELVEVVPLVPGDSVLDVACGDAAFAGWFAERLAGQGYVCAVDLSEAWLAVAQERLAKAAHHVTLLKANVEQMPLDDDTFDVVWCAQSLYSLPHTAKALSQMIRVARPGGIVAILEDDTLHQILLPWPIDLELKIRQAELKSLRKESRDATKYYIGRRLTATLIQAGLTHVVERAKVTTRQPPFDEHTVRFLSEYLSRLEQRVRPFLSSAARKQLEILVSPQSNQYLLSRPDVSVTCLDRLVWGVKPGIVESYS